MEKKNLVTNVGLAAMIAALCDTHSLVATQANPVYLQLGSLDTAVTVTDEALSAVITATDMTIATGLVEGVSPVDPQVTTTIADDTMQLTHTWTNGSGGTVTVEEIGVFDGATGSGTDEMLSHALTGSKPVLDTETFEATYKLVISRP